MAKSSYILKNGDVMVYLAKIMRTRISLSITITIMHYSGNGASVLDSIDLLFPQFLHGASLYIVYNVIVL